MSLRDVIVERIRTHGPITFAEYMELALYHPELGYYARADRRSGRAGDFFTSVDVGPLFGTLLARQFSEMSRLLGAPQFDLVEAGAGSGRLARDILDATALGDSDLYAAVRLRLVERSSTARAAQPAVLGPHVAKLAESTAELPADVQGVIFGNELLDALPTHIVVMSEHGLREVYVDVSGRRLVESTGAPSSPEIEAYLARAGARLRPGWRAEVNLAAIDWIRQAARKLGRGFLLMVDYGHEAYELFSATHAAGTLVAFHRHQAFLPGGQAPLLPLTRHSASLSPGGGEGRGEGGWLQEPGEHDLTAHVDLTSVRLAAEAEGLETLAVLDQTYFLLGLGASAYLNDTDDSIAALKRRLALKTLLLPGGMGSTHKVMILAKAVGRPQLRGMSYRVRVT